MSDATHATQELIEPGTRLYPESLASRWPDPLPPLTLLGDPTLLRGASLAVFCSRQCPGRLILALYDLAQAWRVAGTPVIGGFHTPLEQEVLHVLLRGTGPIVICAARDIGRMRVPPAWAPALAADRLLVVSPFDARHPRITAATATTRNRLVAALAADVFVAHAAPGSRTEALCAELLAAGRRVLTLAGAENAGLLARGAQPIELPAAPPPAARIRANPPPPSISRAFAAAAMLLPGPRGRISCAVLLCLLIWRQGHAVSPAPLARGRAVKIRNQPGRGDIDGRAERARAGRHGPLGSGFGSSGRRGLAEYRPPGSGRAGCGRGSHLARRDSADSRPPVAGRIGVPPIRPVAATRASYPHNPLTAAWN